MTLLRELGRRKLRTTLTILGITIGIWALVVFSSMANKINNLVASGSDYYVGKVVVTDGSTNGLGIGLIPIDLALTGQISAMDGVAAVDPQVQMPYANEGINGFGIPKMIQGQVAGVLAQVTGQYFTNSKPQQSSKASYDENVAARLWQVSAELVGLTPAPFQGH